VQATDVRPLYFGLLELDVAEGERDKVDLGGREVVEDELEGLKARRRVSVVAKY
jgi:hypothetical protein